MVSGYFTECTDIGSENEVIEHTITDGQGREIIQKIPGKLNWNNVTLKRGIITNKFLWYWRKQVEEGNINDAGKNVSIIMMNQAGTDVAQWDFTDAWFSRITAPSVTSSSNEIVIEEVVMMFEGMECITVILQVPDDVNDDGAVNAQEITKVERVIAGLNSQIPSADVNQDGNINSLDITKLERIITGSD